MKRSEVRLQSEEWLKKATVHIVFFIVLTLCPASVTAHPLDQVDLLQKPLILVDKQSFRLFLLDSLGYVEKTYPIACGINKGNKERVGDHKTPEGLFYIDYLSDSSHSYHDFKDGNGPVAGAFGPWFLHISMPNFYSLGIHGTHLPSSIGTRSTEGCIRLKNEDVDDLKHRIRVGIPILILPDESSYAVPDSAQTSPDVYVSHDPYRKEWADSVCLSLQRANIPYSRTSDYSTSASLSAVANCHIFIDVLDCPSGRPHYTTFWARTQVFQQPRITPLRLSDPQKIPLLIQDVKRLLTPVEETTQPTEDCTTYDWTLFFFLALILTSTIGIVLAVRLLIKYFFYAK